MTIQFATQLMPAHTTTDTLSTDSVGTARTSGEEVKAMSLFEPRIARASRAWDELSEIDRAVLLESVRQRRKLQAHKDRIYSEIYNLRSNR